MATLDDIRQEEVRKANIELDKRQHERQDRDDAAIRERLGGKTSAEALVERTGSPVLQTHRDRRQGFEGSDPITDDLLDMVDADLEDIGIVKPATLQEYARRLNAQFPSESSLYNAKDGAFSNVLMLKARARRIGKERAHAQ